MRNVTASSTRAELVDEVGHVTAVAAVQPAEDEPAGERGDEPAAAERVGDAVGERGARDRDHLEPHRLVEPAARRRSDGQRSEHARRDAADDAPADLLDDEAHDSPALWLPSSASPIARAMNSSGTHSPSLRPLSTLSPCRIREGRRASVTTAWPSAASVGASTIASTSASANESEDSSARRRACRRRSSAAARSRAAARARPARGAARARRCGRRRRRARASARPRRPPGSATC